jgi:hypothetical protein
MIDGLETVYPIGEAGGASAPEAFSSVFNDFAVF